MFVCIIIKIGIIKVTLSTHNILIYSGVSILSKSYLILGK